jgi:hypothetical protein
VALEQTDAVLVTAVDHYARAARRQGRILRLSDWAPI